MLMHGQHPVHSLNCTAHPCPKSQCTWPAHAIYCVILAPEPNRAVDMKGSPDTTFPDSQAQANGNVQAHVVSCFVSSMEVQSADLHVKQEACAGRMKSYRQNVLWPAPLLTSVWQPSPGSPARRVAMELWLSRVHLQKSIDLV